MAVNGKTATDGLSQLAPFQGDRLTRFVTHELVWLPCRRECAGLQREVREQDLCLGRREGQTGSGFAQDIK